MSVQALRSNPLLVSIAIHSLIGFVWVVLWLGRGIDFTKRKVDFEVIEYPAPRTATLQPTKPIEKPKAPPPERAVFGVSRKAITATTSAPNAAEVKQGNTVAKEQDNLQLNKDDADSLPIPADDFLLTSMPKLKSEVRIPYPPEAKKANVEGPVVMDILIDKEGRVRKVDLIKGPGFGLNEAAVAAVQGFEFSPAKVGEDTVAVKIRYTYRFVLENR